MSGTPAVNPNMHDIADRASRMLEIRDGKVAS